MKHAVEKIVAICSILVSKVGKSCRGMLSESFPSYLGYAALPGEEGTCRSSFGPSGDGAGRARPPHHQG